MLLAEILTTCESLLLPQVVTHWPEIEAVAVAVPLLERRTMTGAEVGALASNTQRARILERGFVTTGLLRRSRRELGISQHT